MITFCRGNEAQAARPQKNSPGEILGCLERIGMLRGYWPCRWCSRCSENDESSAYGAFEGQCLNVTNQWKADWWSIQARRALENVLDRRGGGRNGLIDLMFLGTGYLDMKLSQIGTLCRFLDPLKSALDANRPIFPKHPAPRRRDSVALLEKLQQVELQEGLKKSKNGFCFCFFPPKCGKCLWKNGCCFFLNHK